MTFFSIFLIPAFFVAGYMVRTMNAASRNEEEPPEFTDWGTMFMDGVKGAVVAVVYGLIPFVIMFVVGFAAGLTGSNDATGLASGLGVLTVLVSGVLGLAINYLLPAAITNLARTGTIGAAFDFDTLGPVLKSKEYITAVLLTFFVAIAIGVVVGVLAVFTLGFGLILLPFFYFWLYLAGSYMFGAAFGRVVETPHHSTEQSATPMD
ncbi:DUF4013 domain-containing protein [Haladaptatus sp. DYF46]|uniref:DUF4013 domain-containing protein n=1 Tax=Haladaptatus sp. DYF46 TaxID=2886041 RepID=UPI001E5678F2|nr:DUF4013 domain-containing protein [Haladaptatus sp. DYF46]